MKSWKKERYRRQKLFYSIKLRRHIGRDMKNWAALILDDWRKRTKILKALKNEPKSDEHTTDRMDQR